MSHEPVLSESQDPVIRVTEYCELAALSCLQGASRRDPALLVQHRPFWVDGVQKATQARYSLDRRVLRLCMDIEARKVMDAGCGFGSTLQYLHDSHPAQYSGLTLSRLEHALGNESIQQKNLQNSLRLFCADWHDALSWRPFPAQDVIFSLESLHLSWNKPAFFAGAVKSMRKEGVLLIADFLSSGQAPADEKDAHALQVFLRGRGAETLLTLEELKSLGEAQYLEVEAEEFLEAGLKEGALERLGSLLGNPFNTDPDLKAWRAAEHASSGYLGHLLKKGLVRYGLVVFRKP